MPQKKEKEKETNRVSAEEAKSHGVFFTASLALAHPSSLSSLITDSMQLPRKCPLGHYCIPFSLLFPYVRGI